MVLFDTFQCIFGLKLYTSIVFLYIIKGICVCASHLKRQVHLKSKLHVHVCADRLLIALLGKYVLKRTGNYIIHILS